jgi:XTP/dITP diphosphohydrolase
MVPTPPQWILASSNPGKFNELSALFAPLGVSLISQTALGVPDAPEPHHTFLENALAKARYASAAAQLPVGGARIERRTWRAIGGLCR